ncbi:VanZ family protein [Bacillus sp. EB106-08-02-XG196]|uniref:VanZ family protein n=1 Tax=Bacillus sp. EB106-08-02-XG196 TaxID=2737049 RepID=UPI0015C4CBDB|nr:VanZ family protein [Bacillus sp. EB106-08-02-XG196]NWQ41107.1 VanZ family protein [Bacillus sp. EB106-08-02-XG196]
MGKRKWWLLATIVWMASIFLVTQLPFFTGENTAKVIQKVNVIELNSIKAQSADPVDINGLNLTVRKVTHVIVFGMLAFLLYKSLAVYQYSFILSWILTVIYAILDEWHQSFILGRVAAYMDVLIDSLGVFIALFLIYLNTIKRECKVSKEKAS